MQKPFKTTVKMRELAMKALSDGQEHSFKEIYEYVHNNAKTAGIEPSYVTTARISAVMQYLSRKTRKCASLRKQWYVIPTTQNNVKQKQISDKPNTSAQEVKAILETASSEVEKIVVKAFSSAKHIDDKAIQQLFQYGMGIKEYLRKAKVLSEAWIELEN